MTIYEQILDYCQTERTFAAQSERDTEIILLTAPSGVEEKRRHLIAERNRIIAESMKTDAMLTKPFVIAGFSTDNDVFAANTEPMLAAFIPLNDNCRPVAKWHWTTAYLVKQINEELSKMVVVDAGIANDFATFIADTNDETLSHIIKRHSLPDGATRPRWKGSKADAARFCVYYGIAPAEWNKTFQFDFKTGMDSSDLNRASNAKTYKDQDRNTPIYKVMEKHPSK